MLLKVISMLLFLVTMASTVSGSEVIKEAQRILNDLGFNAGAVDGLWGSKTEDALNKFYDKQGLAFDGEVDPRAQQLLKLLVEHYISDGTPVASKALAMLPQVGVSSAHSPKRQSITFAEELLSILVCRRLGAKARGGMASTARALPPSTTLYALRRGEKSRSR